MALTIRSILIVTLLACDILAFGAADATAQQCQPATTTTGLQCNVTAVPQQTSDYTGAIIYQPIKTSSVAQCAYFCSRRAVNPAYGQSEGAKYCDSFEYDPNLQSCQLFNMNVSYILDPAPNTHKKGNVYNDLGCYDCGDQFCDTPEGQPYGAQLVDNGNFQNKYSLGLWDTSNVLVTRKGNNTFIALAGPDGPSRSFGGSFLQNFNLCPNNLYQISFDYTYRHNNATSGSEAAPQSVTWPDLEGLDGWGTGISQTKNAGTTTGQARYIFQAGYGPYYLQTLGPSLYSGVTTSTGPTFSFVLALDNFVAFRRESTFAPIPGSTSPVPNGDFESGKVAPWKFTDNNGGNLQNSATTTSPGFNGSNYALQLQLSPYPGTSYYLTSGEFATKPQTMYIMSAQLANANSSTNNPLISQVAFYVNSDGAETTHLFLDSLNSSTPQTFRWPLWANGKTAKVVMLINTLSYNSSLQYALLVDNVRLDEMK